MIHSSYKHTTPPKSSHTGLPTIYYFGVLPRFLAFPRSNQGCDRPSPGFLSMTRRHRTKSVYRHSCVVAKSLLVQQYSFLYIQTMTNDRNLQLSDSLSICVPGGPHALNAKRRWRSTGWSQARLCLREALFLLTKIRLVLLFLIVHTNKYTTLKRNQYRTWPIQMFADIHNVSRQKHQQHKRQ